MAAATVTLTAQQREILFYNCNVHAQTAPVGEAGTIDVYTLATHGCTAARVVQAGIRIECLRDGGALRPHDLAVVGFDALSLQDPATLSQMIAAYGAAPVIDAFCSTADDAVNIAGAAAARLQLSTNCLLRKCANTREHALCIIEYQKAFCHEPLQEVDIDTIMQTGITAKDLCALGWPAVRLLHEKGITHDHLCRLGYAMSL